MQGTPARGLFLTEDPVPALVLLPEAPSRKPDFLGKRNPIILIHHVLGHLEQKFGFEPNFVLPWFLKEF